MPVNLDTSPPHVQVVSTNVNHAWDIFRGGEVFKSHIYDPEIFDLLVATHGVRGGSPGH